jgi:hypothetical protein
MLQTYFYRIAFLASFVVLVANVEFWQFGLAAIFSALLVKVLQDAK